MGWRKSGANKGPGFFDKPMRNTRNALSEDFPIPLYYRPRHGLTNPKKSPERRAQRL
jgi:hypothetical protein